jgi:hypothetical protein
MTLLGFIASPDQNHTLERLASPPSELEFKLVLPQRPQSCLTCVLFDMAKAKVTAYLLFLTATICLGSMQFGYHLVSPQSTIEKLT